MSGVLLTKLLQRNPGASQMELMAWQTGRGVEQASTSDDEYQADSLKRKKN